MTDRGTELTSESTDDGLLLRGEIDAHTAPDLARAIDDRLGSVTGDVRLHMRDVSFMDSSGLRVLLDATATARQHGRDLVLVGPPASVRRLLEITGLADHLAVWDETT